MCGITGWVGTNKDVEQDENLIRRMLMQLVHRGPDSFVTRLTDKYSFGHVRLSIVDLSDSAIQPMPYKDGRYWIIFNGEIYNFIELRQELYRYGYEFQTLSDTEVVLAAYDYWREDCLNHFNGMWAFALYDQQEGICFLARDRFGVKPLYYSVVGDRLYFASEMKALLAAGVSGEPNYETIRWYLKDAGCDRGDLTPFLNIHALPAGHYIIVKEGRLYRSRWWETLGNLISLPAKFEDRVVEFRELLQDAVRIRLRNDVNTAITLSGGMDSSSIYSLSKKLSQNRQVVTSTSGEMKEVKIYSVSYPGELEDESRYVQECAQLYNDQINFVYPNPADFPKLINEVIWHQESFVWNASVFAFHIIYKQIAADGIRVILEGHGSDEMLAGYPYMAQSAIAAFRGKGDIKNYLDAVQCLNQSLNPAINEKPKGVLKTILSDLLIPLRKYSFFQKKFNLMGHALKQLGKNQIIGMNPALYWAPEFFRAPQDRERDLGEYELDALKAVMYDAFHYRILPNVLRVFDRATMASSIESRAPFMDYRIVQYVFSLPAADLIGGKETKHILRQSMRELLPASITQRRAKLGFAISFKQWFRDPVVLNYIQSIIHDSSFAEDGFLDKQELIKQFDRTSKSGFTPQDSARIWEVLNVALFWKTFVKGEGLR